MRLTGYVLLTDTMADLYRILDELDDPESNDNGRRADLIDSAIELAELDPECARAWAAYR